MNKSLLHKETGDKESKRRGRYLDKLLAENALGPNKRMLKEPDTAIPEYDSIKAYET